MAGLAVAPGEIIRVPKAGYEIGQGHAVIVLYASRERITLKYTGEDSVVSGYAIHIDGVCVEPTLLALYEKMNAAGRSHLPALRAEQPFGRARGGEIQVAIRDTVDSWIRASVKIGGTADLPVISLFSENSRHPTGFVVFSPID